MVICKYFQQGCCRYGQNCRYEHVYSSKYSYHAGSNQQQAPTSNTITDEQLVNQVHQDIQAALKGGQWILSCYSPYKEKACFPGIADLSQEEARLIIYEAKANNTLDQAVSYMNNLFKETRQKYEQLIQPSAQITKILRSLYNGEPVTSPFGSGNQGFGSNATSIFRSAVQNDPFQNQQSVFSQHTTNPQSIFAQARQNIFGPSQPSNIFQTQPQENSTAKSIFAQASQSTFSQPQHQQQSVFASNPQQQSVIGTNQQQNVFATNPQSVFAINQSQQNVFSSNQQQNPFGVQQNQTANVFQQSDGFRNQTTDVFGVSKNAFQQQPVDDSNVYSKIEELSPSDLDAFNSAEFKLGFIPELPPPHSLCI
ncbi:nucleoporin-like protein amo1 [Zerene cesonia]|uniref:nucleoporin-like protein amo1 n=1 Tax=Zerene cesonia TaxID=33412 RepID=UPI0018E505F3|nr:nucleoporin-like protein amo1 [Zerene cesonia]